MSETITITCLHDSATQRTGGAQVYSGDTAAVLARLGQLHGFVTPRNGSEELAFAIPTDLVHLYNQPPASGTDLYTHPEHLDVLAEATRRGLVGRNDSTAPADYLYSQYNVAGRAGIEAINSLREKPRHIHMGHTWSILTQIIGVGSESDIVRMFQEGELAQPRRQLSPDRIEAELRILQEADNIAIQTRAEHHLLSAIYSREMLLNRAIQARLGISADLVESFAIPAAEIFGKLIHVPLGVHDRCHVIGELDSQARQFKKRRAKEKIMIEIDQKRDSRPPEWQLDAEKLAQFQNDTLYYYFAGRFEPGKGVVEALHGYKEFMLDYLRGGNHEQDIAMIFGGGPFNGPVYEEFMQVLADTESAFREQLMSRIVLTGRTDFYPMEVLGDVFVGTSDNESFYLVMAEAMAMGNGVIGTNYPTIRSVSGYDQPCFKDRGLDTYARPQIINPKNPSEVAQSMTAFLDPYYRELNGVRNRKMAASYTNWQSTVILTEELHNRSTGQHLWTPPQF